MIQALARVSLRVTCLVLTRRGVRLLSVHEVFPLAVINFFLSDRLHRLSVQRINSITSVSCLRRFDRLSLFVKNSVFGKIWQSVEIVSRRK